VSTPTPTARPFDEHLWPIQSALVVWACVLSGTVVALGGFDDPRLLHNGWARLAAIAATLAILAWAASSVDSQTARRLKLAVVLSLMFHTVLVVLLCQQRIELDAALTTAKQTATQEQPADATVPEEFSLNAPDSQSGREAFDRPVSTPAPGPAGSQLAAEHRTSADTGSLQQPITAPDAKPQFVLRLLPLQPPQLALAQQAPSPAERSRRPRQDTPPASVVTEARPELADMPLPPARSTRSASLPAAPTDASPSADLSLQHLSSGPQIAMDSVADVPEHPAQVMVHDLPRQRLADRPPATAQDWSRVRSGGVLDRPLRSRYPSPAAPVMSPWPPLATTAPAARQPGDTADEQPSTASDATASLVRPQQVATAGDPHVTPVDDIPRREVAIDVPVGSGGLGRAPADESGLPDRLAARDADLIHLTPARLPNRRVGGQPVPDGAARQPAAAFAQRHARQQHPEGLNGQPSSKTEAAIELGLEFLARAQLDDGHWEFAHLGADAEAADSPPIIRADAAATGLALLSFLGAGYDHFDDRYQHVVERGLDYLIRSQSPSGEIFPEGGQAVGQVTRFYSHGIASLALCEAYGMTGDPQLRTPAQAALDYLAVTQHAERGGWRYDAGASADLSVTGWQLLALRSGELAGLQVRPQAYQGIRYLLEQCREEGGQRALFRYHPWASPDDTRTRHGLQPGTVMTSVGLLVGLYLDGDRDDRRMRLGADHLLANLPQLGEAGEVAPIGTLGNPMRDTYYWYYATQVMFHMGGEYWARWNGALHPLLVQSQTLGGPLAGSWDPARPLPDKWAAYGGRIYVTTLNLLSLEVTYRHLPLYNTAAPRVAEGP
jgi:hypothetical protein